VIESETLPPPHYNATTGSATTKPLPQVQCLIDLTTWYTKYIPLVVNYRLDPKVKIIEQLLNYRALPRYIIL
jgi:hypothetical protein